MELVAMDFLLYQVLRLEYNLWPDKINVFVFLVDKWKVHRRLISPTISQSIITTHLPIFNKHIKRFVSNLPMKGHFFDILPSIRLCKIEMFIDAALGTEWEPGMKQRYLQHFVAYVYNSNFLDEISKQMSFIFEKSTNGDIFRSKAFVCTK